MLLLQPQPATTGHGQGVLREERRARGNVKSISDRGVGIRPAFLCPKADCHYEDCTLIGAPSDTKLGKASQTSFGPHDCRPLPPFPLTNTTGMAWSQMSSAASAWTTSSGLWQDSSCDLIPSDPAPRGSGLCYIHDIHLLTAPHIRTQCVDRLDYDCPVYRYIVGCLCAGSRLSPFLSPRPHQIAQKGGVLPAFCPGD